MKIYKCTVSYRDLGGGSPVRCKIFFIKADDPIAAFIKAQQETKKLYNVYPPEVEELVMPRIDFTCTKEEIIQEYGTVAFKKAQEDFGYEPMIHKTRDGSRRDLFFGI